MRLLNDIFNFEASFFASLFLLLKLLKQEKTVLVSITLLFKFTLASTSISAERVDNLSLDNNLSRVRLSGQKNRKKSIKSIKKQSVGTVIYSN
jgi:hypothetical protein